MNNRTKKWLLVAGCLVICAVLVVLIGGSFSKEPAQDDPLPALEDTPGGVTVDPGTDGSGADAGKDDSPTVVVVKPETQTPAGGGAVSTGTEQTIQPDVTKPEYDEETLKDPTKTPDGKPVDGSPTPVDHDSVSTPDAPVSNGPQGGDTNSKGQVYVPGFGWIDDVGEGQGTTNDDMYENGNKIGIMN